MTTPATPARRGVLVVGSVTADLTTFSDRLPVPGETIIGREFTLVLGGKGANQVVAAGLAGVPASMVACVGQDGFGELTTEEWFGFHAPARTPASVVAAANAAINAALKDKSVIDGLGVVGLIAQGSTPDEMARSQAAELARWAPLVKRIGFTADS